MDDVIRAYFMSGNSDSALLDEPLNLGTGLSRQYSGEIAIDSDARLVGRDDEPLAIQCQAARLAARAGSGTFPRFLRTMSMTRLSGARMSEMNCDVEKPMMRPRSSPR